MTTSDTELLLMFADVICPKLRDTLVPHGASAANWDAAAEQLRRIADVLVTVRRQNERMRAALREVANDYDHEEQTHDHQPFKYGGTCRECLAQRALDAVDVLEGPK